MCSWCEECMKGTTFWSPKSYCTCFCFISSALLSLVHKDSWILTIYQLEVYTRLMYCMTAPHGTWIHQNEHSSRTRPHYTVGPYRVHVVCTSDRRRKDNELEQQNGCAWGFNSHHMACDTEHVCQGHFKRPPAITKLSEDAVHLGLRRCAQLVYTARRTFHGRWSTVIQKLKLSFTATLRMKMPENTYSASLTSSTLNLKDRRG